MDAITPSTLGPSLLRSQYATASKFALAIGAFCTPFDAIETATQTLYAWLDPYQAQGSYLDAIGAEVGFPRDVSTASGSVATLDDPTYSVLVVAAGVRNRSRGTHAETLTFFDTVVNSPANVASWGRTLVQVFDTGCQLFRVAIFRPPVTPEDVLWPTIARFLAPAGVAVGSVATVPFGSLYPIGTEIVGFVGDSPGATIGFCAWEAGFPPSFPTQVFLEELPL